MSCRRALDIDLSAYLVEADQPQWTEFRLHYPTCRECSREVASATAVVPIRIMAPKTCECRKRWNMFLEETWTVIVATFLAEA